MGQESYYSFEQVLKELQIEKEELEKFIHEGELRAFSSDGKIKFLRSDIDTLKFTKMDQPTIAMREKGEDVDVIEEIVDEVSPEPMPKEKTSRVEQKPIFQIDPTKRKVREVEPPVTKESPEESEMASPLLDMSSRDEQDDKPLLDVSDNSNPLVKVSANSDPLLNISEDSDPLLSRGNTYNISKPEVEELVFEKKGGEGGDDILETGELLFESKDKKLEEILSDSSISYSDFDERESTSFRDAVDLSEGEEIVESSTPYRGGALAIDESGKRQTIKTVSFVTICVLAFVGLVFWIVSSPERAIEVTVCKIDYVASTSVDNTFQTILKGKEIKPIVLEDGGQIANSVSTNIMVKKGDTVALLKSPVSIEIKLKQTTEEVSKQENRQKEIETSLAENKKTIAKLAGTNKKIAEVIKVYEAYLNDKSEANRDKLFSLKSSIGKKEYKDCLALIKEKRKLESEKENQRKTLEEIKTTLSELKRVYDAGITIVSPEDGIVRNWDVKDGDTVSAGKHLCDFELIHSLQGEFSIPKEVSLLWTAGQKIVLEDEKKTKIEGILEKVDQNDKTVTLTISVANQNYLLKSESKASFVYKTKQLALGVPESSVLREEDNAFLMVIKEGKILRCKVNLGEHSGNFVAIEEPSLKKGDEIVHTSQKPLKELKDGDNVVIKQE